jgi:hypothetical protein
MSMDLEPAGALATAGLVAKTIEGDVGKTAHTVAVGERCKNCDAPLAGPYCHHCGQFGHVHRSLLHLLEELVHGISTSIPGVGARCPCCSAVPAC